MTLGDKIVVMHEGHIQQAGTPLELYQQPQACSWRASSVRPG
jgi:multiple sugar transport system ATP-binding protein